jgi:hypothetical protein
VALNALLLDSHGTPLSASDSQHFKGLKRGVLRAFWDHKTENGVFFGQKSFLTQFSLFSAFSCIRESRLQPKT